MIGYSVVHWLYADPDKPFRRHRLIFYDACISVAKWSVNKFFKDKETGTGTYKRKLKSRFTLFYL
jgi:hypothetical protein